MENISRKYYILKLIVEEFIKTAKPVGSHTLIEQYNLNYSSATIRNEMFELEEEGLIEKPIQVLEEFLVQKDIVIMLNI